MARGDVKFGIVAAGSHAASALQRRGVGVLASVTHDGSDPSGRDLAVIAEVESVAGQVEVETLVAVRNAENT